MSPAFIKSINKNLKAKLSSEPFTFCLHLNKHFHRIQITRITKTKRVSLKLRNHQPLQTRKVKKNNSIITKVIKPTKLIEITQPVTWITFTKFPEMKIKESGIGKEAILTDVEEISKTNEKYIVVHSKNQGSPIVSVKNLSKKHKNHITQMKQQTHYMKQKYNGSSTDRVMLGKHSALYFKSSCHLQRVKKQP